MIGVSWDVNLHPAVEQWFLALPDDEADGVSDAIDALAEHGPGLGRPLVDRINASRYHHMKELRPITSHGRVRILFCFDPDREAILLVAGDKTGQWRTWYDRMIPVADDRYEEYLETKENPT